MADPRTPAQRQRDWVRQVLEEPERLYELSPLGLALHEALRAAREQAPGCAAVPEAQWEGVCKLLISKVRRGDLLLRDACDHALAQAPAVRRDAMRAELEGVQISGRVSSFTVLPRAVRMLVEDAEVCVPSTGRTLLGGEPGCRLLIVAASSECFPPPAAIVLPPPAAIVLPPAGAKRGLPAPASPAAARGGRR